MKKITTTILVIASTLSMAFSNATNDSALKTVEHKTNTASTLKSLSQLLEENATLRLQAIALGNDVAELESHLAYETMMINMFASMEQKAREEEKAELEASIAFTKMMGSMLIHVQTDDYNEKVAEHLAKASYERMMQNMFSKLSTQSK